MSSNIKPAVSCLLIGPTGVRSPPRSCNQVGRHSPHAHRNWQRRCCCFDSFLTRARTSRRRSRARGSVAARWSGCAARALLAAGTDRVRHSELSPRCIIRHSVQRVVGSKVVVQKSTDAPGPETALLPPTWARRRDQGRRAVKKVTRGLLYLCPCGYGIIYTSRPSSTSRPSVWVKPYSRTEKQQRTTVPWYRPVHVQYV